MRDICIYAEQENGAVSPYTAELVTAARTVLPQNGRIILLAFGPEPEALAAQLSFPGVEAAVVRTELSPLQDDALAVLAEGALRQLAPSCVLLPAVRTARALFSRVAVRLDVGMTADCSQLLIGEDGEFLQRKSAFGSNAEVITAEVGEPKLVSVQTGVWEPCSCDGPLPPLRVLPADGPSSRVEVLETVEDAETPLAAAELVLSLGRGALEGNSLALARRLAQVTGGHIGCTRPLVDAGVLPFPRQIGQTGCTVRPKVCIYLGVSGAVQHTEGVRCTGLSIAVNRDSQAAVFSCADYGAVLDVEELLEALLQLY